MYTRKDANEFDAMDWGGDGGLDVVLEPRWYFPYSTESQFGDAVAVLVQQGFHAARSRPRP